MIEWIWLVPLFPLIGVVFNGFLGSRLPEKVVGWIGSLLVGLSFVVGLLAYIELLGMDAHHRTVTVPVFTWLLSGSFKAAASILVDPLSCVMMLVVAGVSFVIHIYSIGYMRGDRGFARYFCELNLFVFFMLTLVMGDNYLIMFIGWEGVGLCSYLLIGFWYEDDEKANAGKKAFIVNRIGDFGFLVGIMLMFATFGTVSYLSVFERAAHFPIGSSVITAITLCLFVGAIGKSAQIPLYVWLPDAMAGPTPVSALIHAATMVTAGVYMVARSNLLYSLAPVSLYVVAIVGAVTAIYAASIGLVQNDIKKVLAYSTVSQLGYMFLACGVGAFAVAIFHLMTHAFFKALLFLGSGSVIHALSGEQDIRNMGGLKNKIPITFVTFLVATLAIAGIPGFSGFFSKDEILFKAFSGEHKWLWVVGVIAAAMTAFYMFRLVYLTFYGEFRGGKKVEEHIHESPPTMTVPLIILAVFSVIGGYIGLPHALGGGAWFEKWLHPVVTHEHLHMMQEAHAHPSLSTEYLLMALSVLVALGGILFAYLMYQRDPSLPGRIVDRAKTLYKVLLNKYYVDEIYNAVVVQPLLKMSDVLDDVFDMKGIDGLVNGVAWVVAATGKGVRRIQTGFVQNYALFMGMGIAILLGYLLLK
jgi:NADH-quinone oxidoreductase subunit L